MTELTSLVTRQKLTLVIRGFGRFRSNPIIIFFILEITLYSPEVIEFVSMAYF